MAGVRVEKDGCIPTVILDRPAVRNAIDRATAEALADAFRSFDADPAARVAVLYGVGTFSSGADLKAVSRGGDSALHVAAQRGYDRAIRFLVEKGAALNVRNARGLTPLGTLLARPATATERASTIQTLRSLGAE